MAQTYLVRFLPLLRRAPADKQANAGEIQIRPPRRKRMFGLQASGAAASWVVGRMGTDAHLYDDPYDASIPELLDSRFDADKVDALKRLLALIAQGVDVAHLFPQVTLLIVLP